MTIEKLSEWIHHRERNVKRIEEGQGKGEIRFEGGKWSAEGILLVFQIPKVQCASKSGRFPLAANRFRIFSRDSRIRNVRIPSRAWKMAQLPPLFQFSVKGNKFSLARSRERGHDPKILRCKFSDRINGF